MAGPQSLIIEDIRGGMDDQTPPHLLPKNRCVLARNVEFFLSSLGERRLGSAALDLTGSGLDSFDTIVHLNTFQPEFADIWDSELWAVSATEGGSFQFAHRVGSTWSPITPFDDLLTASPDVYRIRSVSLHGKFFIAYPSGQTRLHVWDGTTFRRAGLAAPVLAPTAIDEGSGAYTDTRIFRVRFIVKSGSTILLRSEPSPELTFTPSGTGAGATVTRPAQVFEGETDWELEASDGDGNFYIIATVPIATTTYNDETQPATTYADAGDLSADLGEYALFPSVRFLLADEDRLIGLGDFDDPTHGSRISWSPVSNAIGVGNDERLPTDTNNFIDLDWMEGGNFTGASKPNNGSFYAFKHLRIYKVQRTYTDVNEAYDSYLLTTANGAVYGSVVDGMDEYGRACTYFLDPQSGPCRISSGGLQYMRGLRNTWATKFNGYAQKIAAHGVYYPDKQQVKWWIATGTSDTPTYILTVQVNSVESGSGETWGGFSVADGALATAYCSTIVPEPVKDSVTGALTLVMRPYSGHTSSMYIQRDDVGSTDAGTTYKALILTRPEMPSTLINWWGAMMGALLAEANSDRTVRVQLSFIRDFGTEQSSPIITDLRPHVISPVGVPEELGSENPVIKRFDHMVMSEATAIQLQIEDP